MAQINDSLLQGMIAHVGRFTEDHDWVQLNDANKEFWFQVPEFIETKQEDDKAFMRLTPAGKAYYAAMS